MRGEIFQPLRVIAAPHQLDDPIADPERLGVRDQIGGRGAGPKWRNLGIKSSSERADH